MSDEWKDHYMGMSGDEEANTFAEELVKQIKGCGDVLGLQGMAVRLTHELSEARDIAFIGMTCCAKLVSEVNEFKYASVEERESLTSLVETIQEFAHKQMRNRWSLTSEIIKQVAEDEEKEWLATRSKEQVH